MMVQGRSWDFISHASRVAAGAGVFRLETRSQATVTGAVV
jgi:hypothetical protein